MTRTHSPLTIRLAGAALGLGALLIAGCPTSSAASGSPGKTTLVVCSAHGWPASWRTLRSAAAVMSMRWDIPAHGQLTGIFAGTRAARGEPVGLRLEPGGCHLFAAPAANQTASFSAALAPPKGAAAQPTTQR